MENKKPKFVLNSDKELVDLINEGLKKKGGYCPCVILKNEDTKCPCKEYRETAECVCGKFIE